MRLRRVTELPRLPGIAMQSHAPVSENTSPAAALS